jgi:Ser/Thr protein kinase RdoA (MazF antagonist)
LLEAARYWQYADHVHPEWGMGIPLRFCPFPAFKSDMEAGQQAVWCRWKEGIPIKEITPDICDRIGRTLGQLHHCAGHFREVLALPAINGPLLEDIVQKTGAAPLFAVETNATRQSFMRSMKHTIGFLSDFPVTPAYYGVIHTDAHFGNWLLHPPHFALIDFDYTAYGHYWTDLAVVFQEIGRLLLRATEVVSCREALLRGYWTVQEKKADFEAAWPHFQVVALALYVNWSLDPAHSDLLQDPQIQAATLAAVRSIAFGGTCL